MWRIQEIKGFLHRYEKYLSPAALIAGFIIDSLTFTRADVQRDHYILIGYLVILGVSILLLNAYEAGRFQSGFFTRIILLSPLAMQFAFGGLFSGFVVLYSRSASLSASWPFLFPLALLLVGNEFLRNRYRRLAFPITIYFIAVFSYLILAVPVFLNAIGPWLFLLSGVLSLLFIYLLMRVLRRISPDVFAQYRRTVAVTVLIVFGAFNFLYFTGIIPPIPLALKDLILAHRLVHGDSNLVVTYEPPRWYHLFRDFNPTYHAGPGEPVYLYSAIYAPAQLKTTISHAWEHFDETSDSWVVRSEYSYPISGGREQGFRGYSYITNARPGRWRVTVKTKHGQVLGRTTFTVVTATEPPKLVTESR